MKARAHSMPAACPETSPSVQLVQVEVSLTHPLLLLKQALPWDATGANTAKTSMGGQGCPGMSPCMCPWWCSC